MTNLTTSGSAHAACLTYGIGRKVVVEQERIFVLTFQGINNLHIPGSTQSNGYDCLGLTTGEQGGTMSAWQNAYFNLNRANGFVIPAINTRLSLQNLLTNNGFFDAREALFYIFR